MISEKKWMLLNTHINQIKYKSIMAKRIKKKDQDNDFTEESQQVKSESLIIQKNTTHGTNKL